MNEARPLKVRIGSPVKRDKNNAATVTRVDVYDDIGDGGWFGGGISAQEFVSQVSGIKGEIEVHINSGGGDVFDGIAISSAIRDRKGKSVTVVDGLAASIASVIAQAGTERVVAPGGMFMIHDAFGGCVGDATEMAKMAETLDQVSGNIAGIYASRAGGTVADWRDAMRKETWYTADEAVAAGLADRVGDVQAELPPGIDLAAFTSVPGRIAASLRALPAAKAPVIVAADGNHAPMTGSHAHSHPAYGSQGSDTSHSHEHSHSNDANHGHSHADANGDGEPDGTQDHAPRRLYARDGRLLGLESMPLTAKAFPVHHTATTDEPWDGPAAVAAMPNDDTVLKYCHAWESDAAAAVPHREGDDDADDQKSNYKFPHHKTDGAPANLAACRNGLARLSSADIPDADRAGVEAHLRAHLADGSEDGAEDAAHPDLSGITPEQLRAALRGATE